MEPLKEKVLKFVQEHGPAVPLEVSKGVDRESIFVGAVLSDLLSNKMIKISKAKVGGSPLYYAAGQEENLSRLFNSLPEKEKEVYNLLKEKKFIADEDAEPAVRVALRMLQDFAMPMEMEGRLFWRWHLTPQTEFNLQQQVQPKKEIMQVQEQKQVRLFPVKKSVKDEGIDDFTNVVDNYIKKNNIVILSKEYIKKNRELGMMVQVPSNVGSMQMYLLAKNKKTITDNDMILAYNRGNEKKLPTLFLTAGTVTKKAEMYKEKNLKGYVIIRSL